jgi:cytochrome P450
MTAEPELVELRAKYRRDYDPYSHAPISEHLAELADRREQCPVSYSTRGNGCWVATTFDDIESLLRRNNKGFVSFPLDPDAANPQGKKDKMIPIELDGPTHRQYRSILEPLFSPKEVRVLEPKLRQAANQLIDEFIEDGACDFVRQFAMPFPGATVIMMMGWPLKDLELLNSLASMVLHGVKHEDPEQAAAIRLDAQVRLGTYLHALIAERRASTDFDDMTAHLIHTAEVDGQKLTDDELFDLFLNMVLAGLDTVQSVLAQSMVHLAAQPEKWTEMFANPEVTQRALQELLRLTGPTALTRTVSEDYAQVGDVRLPRGERVHFAIPAANRDPKYFPNPDAVDFERPVKPNMAFGLGPHRCVGSHLATLELQIAFEELHRRIPEFSLNPDIPQRDHLGLVWGVDDVHLTFPPGARESQA